MKIVGDVDINTLITAGALLVSGALAYATLDKRVTVLEQIASERATRVEEQLTEIKKDIRELAKTVNTRERQDKQ